VVVHVIGSVLDAAVRSGRLPQQRSQPRWPLITQGFSGSEEERKTWLTSGNPVTAIRLSAVSGHLIAATS